jgi:hypothetical protein
VIFLSYRRVLALGRESLLLQPIDTKDLSSIWLTIHPLSDHVKESSSLITVVIKVWRLLHLSLLGITTTALEVVLISFDKISLRIKLNVIRHCSFNIAIQRDTRHIICRHIHCSNIQWIIVSTLSHHLWLLLKLLLRSKLTGKSTWLRRIPRWLTKLMMGSWLSIVGLPILHGSTRYHLRMMLLKWRSLCSKLTLIVLIILLLNCPLRLHLMIEELLLLWILALNKRLILARGSLRRPLESLSMGRNHCLITRVIGNILILVAEVHLVWLHVWVHLIVLRSISSTTTTWTLILRRSLLTIPMHLRILSASHGQSKVVIRGHINATLYPLRRWRHHSHVSAHSSRKLLLLEVSCI